MYLWTRPAPVYIAKDPHSWGGPPGREMLAVVVVVVVVVVVAGARLPFIET